MGGGARAGLVVDVLGAHHAAHHRLPFRAAAAAKLPRRAAGAQHCELPAHEHRRVEALLEAVQLGC
eukprot:10662988-Alexandrium_andersonii.AAC.1